MNPVMRLKTVVFPEPFGPDQRGDAARLQRE